MTQEIRCQDGDCTRLVAKLEGGLLLVKCPRCGAWRSVPVASLVQGMAAELAICTHGANGKDAPTRIFV